MNALRAFSASSLTAVPRAGLRSAARPAFAASLRRAEIRPRGRASPPFGANAAPARAPSVALRAAADMATAPPSADAAAFISSFNADYARIHEAYENNFWET
jgi:predicted lipid-binding transport protein (Tim44 family)